MLKIPRKLFEQHIETETNVFRYLKSIKSPLIEKGIPDILYSGKMGNKPVLIKKVVRGTCLENLIAKRGRPFWKLRTERNLTVVINWLIKFHSLTKNGELILESDLLNRYFSPILNVIQKDETIITNKKYILSKIEDLKDLVQGKHIPLVSQHRDFSPTNIFLNNSIVIVLDWEICKKSGEPLYDVFYFLSRYFFLMYYDPKTEPIADFKTIAKFAEATYFTEKGYIHDMVSGLVKKYCQNLGIDINVAKMLFLWQEIDKNKNFDILNLFFEKEDKFII